MNAPKIGCLVAALVVAAPLALPAQQAAPVAPGDRVRVSRLGTIPPQVCTVLALKADTLVLDAEDRVAPLKLPLPDVKKLEVSRGTKSNVANGALTGGLVGGAFGLVLGAAAWLGSDPDDFVSFGPEAVPIGVGFLGGAGASVGLLIGAMTRSDRWEEIPLDRLRVTIVPQRRRGLSVGLRVRF